MFSKLKSLALNLASFPILLGIGIFTLFMSCVALLESYFFSRYREQILQFWSKTLLKVCRVQLHIENQWDQEVPASVFLFNHLSLLDIPIALLSIPKSIHFGAKSELFKIPFFGKAMANYGVFPILRSNIRSAIHSYEGALKRLKNGENFILAPEGTRQETAQLGHFKSGPFILALKANSPVIPILILGPEKILSKKSLFLNIAQVNHIYVRILKPIPSSNFDIEQKEEYKKEVFEIMQKNFEEMKSKFYK